VSLNEFVEPQVQRTPSPGAGPDAERVRHYVPTVLQQHLADDPAGLAWSSRGSAAFVDVSGFTRLSESLARKGREGAEQITEIVGRVFERMLAVSYANGGRLLKFGGDALLLWFAHGDHAAHACRTAIEMRDILREIGTVVLPDTTVTLQVAQGVHTGDFHFFAVGRMHRELLPVGPAWSRLVTIQHAASAGEIVISADTAAHLPPHCIGNAKADDDARSDAAVAARLLVAAPATTDDLVVEPPPQLPYDTLAHCLSPAIRAHVVAGGGAPEHRPVTIAFVHFDGTDELLARDGASAFGEGLASLMNVIEASCAEQDVAFLASDVDHDGGKLILTAGAPKVTGNDEERMLLALRKIVSASLPIPLRIGVHRGAVFAGDVGPSHRRTYTVMGDAVNLAARLMAKAEPGHIYATADVIERSNTLFEATELEPFAVKGKAEPVKAWSIGAAKGSRTRQPTLAKLPLTGRNAELGVIRKAYASARGGAGRLIDVTADAGLGKTRLLEALRDAAAGFTKLRGSCEAYTTSTPYALWTELLREFMQCSRDDDDDVVVARLTQAIATKIPDLAPWLPLVAIAFGIELPATPEVDALAEANRRERLHECVVRFVAATLAGPALIEIENAQHMDEASAELLAYVARALEQHPWLVAVARRPSADGFEAPEAPTVVRIELKALAAPDALRLAQLATQQNPLPPHVLDVVAKRSGGNPQFLRDLLRKVIQSGGTADLPDSAEAATMAQIDGLAPDDRAVVRRAAVFGLTFHPRMLAWFADEGEPAPAPDVWSRLTELFDEEPDGYLRFRRSLLRDAAYEGLPFKLRRRLHAAVARHLQDELHVPDEAAGILSLHYFEAGEVAQAWQYANVAAKRASSVFAHVEAANLYLRAIAAGRQIATLAPEELATVHRSLADAWYAAGEFRKASEAYAAARALVADIPLRDARLMLKLSYVEEKLGNYAEAARWTEKAREVLGRLDDPEAAREMAQSSAWYAMLLQFEGRTDEALEWAQRAKDEAEAAGHVGALAEAYFVMGWAHGELGREGGEALMQRSLECLQRQGGNLSRQAGVLLSLGVISQWEGRWDEALARYEQGREANVKAGDAVGAALARINVAEILTDRGEWAEAEAMLLETLPFWKASQYHYYLAACLSLLGRVSLRRGRLDEALARLEESKTQFLHVGAEQEVPAVEARIAETRAAMGQPEAALEIVNALLARVDASTGVVRVQPLLERLQGHALMQQGDLWGARDALEASLASAREKNNLFEATLTMLSLIELDRLEGVEPPLDMLDETRTRLANLKVRAVPPVPVPAT
jgi:class 3 adenylate cyclase/tetratricopeptide (TPR) repeat protein